jgi:hypothetical protein
MYAKRFAAAAAGLCLMWGTAQAGNETTEQPSAAAPAQAPGAVGGTNGGVVVIEIGPAQGGGEPSAEDVAAMQMLLLQFLLMQSEGAGNAEMIDRSRAPAGVGI